MHRQPGCTRELRVVWLAHSITGLGAWLPLPPHLPYPAGVDGPQPQPQRHGGSQRVLPPPHQTDRPSACRQTDRPGLRLTDDISSTKTFLPIPITPPPIHTMASRSAISRLTPRALGPRVAVPRSLSTAAATSRAAVATTPMARVAASPSRYLLSSLQQQRRMASSESADGGESMVSLSRASSTHRRPSAKRRTTAAGPAPGTLCRRLIDRPFLRASARDKCMD